MLFTSLEFLFLFLPITFGVYFLLPFGKGFKNYWLLLASLLFYAWGEPTFVFVMLLSIVFNYCAAVVISIFKNRWCIARLFLWLSIIGNLSIIGLWKYANFITETIRAWFPSLHGVIPQTSFVLPIGISFFTFQAMSYVIDVYRGTVGVQRNPFFLALYIALFPQLIAGPIVRYSTVCDQIMNRRTTWELFSSGVMRFLMGFSKKMLLANLFAVTADRFFAARELSVCGAWLGAIAYTMQIFFDFSGYSDMAIGLGRMFGFKFLENFNYPYISKSITEFWRRWHISLGSWFRDYLYFPLGGSRVDSRKRLVFNLSVVWFATGVWHGANWTFILWGVLYGILITIEKLTGLPERIDRNALLRVVGWFGTMFFVILGWVLFRSVDLSSAKCYLGAMFGIGTCGFIDDKTVFEFGEIKVVLLFGLLASVPLADMVKNRMNRHPALLECLHATSGIMLIMLFVVGVSYLSMNAHNPFIYFNF